MVDTREIFWNIGHGSISVMYLLAFVSLGVMGYGFVLLSRLWRQGRPVDRFDQPGPRLLRYLADVLSQRRVTREPAAGLLHAGLFWGYLLLFAGTLLLLFQVDLLTPIFSVNLLQGRFYRIFSLVLDIAGIAAILTLLGLFIRRYLIRPEGLQSTSEDLLGHLLLFSILLTGFLIEGSRMAVTELHEQPGLALWSPGGYLLALVMGSAERQNLLTLHRLLWWLHLLLGLGFVALIPFTKLRHIFTSGGNSYLAPLDPGISFATIDLEDESAERFGASRIEDLSWKDLYDADACTACKRCQDRCPAWITGKPLSPMKVVRQIGTLARGDSAADLIAEISPEVIWACTTCAACQETCPVCVEHVSKIVDMRRSLTLMDGLFPGPEVRRATGAIEVNGNPFGLAPATRGAWAEGLPVSVMAVDRNVDLLYFAGCYASFDPRNRKVAESFVQVCAAAGLKVGILGPEERCCGEPVRKLGNEYLYQSAAEANIAAFRKYGVQRIVTACPHCSTTLGRDYRDLGFVDVKVEHSSTFISRLVEERRLKLDPVPFEFTWHDPCQLSRFNGVVDEPRHLLAAAGGTLREMEWNGAGSFCCGAGGGRILAEERIGRRINAERLRMATSTGAPLLASACPFCLAMFEEAITAADASDGIKVYDLAEIIASKLRK